MSGSGGSTSAVSVPAVSSSVSVGTPAGGCAADAAGESAGVATGNGAGATSGTGSCADAVSIAAVFWTESTEALSTMAICGAGVHAAARSAMAAMARIGH